MTNTVHAFYNATHRDGPAVIHTPEDMDDLIDKLLAEPFEHSIATLYNMAGPRNKAGLPKYQLMLAVDPTDNVGGVAYMGYCHGQGGNWYSKGQTSQYEEVTYYFVGNEHEFPRDSEISIKLVRQAAKEFLSNNGECPSCVEWQLREAPDA